MWEKFESNVSVCRAKYATDVRRANLRRAAGDPTSLSCNPASNIRYVLSGAFKRNNLVKFLEIGWLSTMLKSLPMREDIFKN